MKKLLTCVALSACAFAAVAETLTIATGEPKKGYSKIFADMNNICGKQSSLQEVNTAGGLDNLSELASKKAHLGMVQVDVFQAMEKTDDAIGRLKAVMSLNSNLLHIVVNQAGYAVETGKECSGRLLMGKCVTGDWRPVVTNKIIEKIDDLKGANVAAVGSAQVLARRYLNGEGLKLGLNIIDTEKDAQAFADLKAGKVQAVLTMAAYPSGPINGLKQADGFTLVNWTRPATGVYKTAKKNYKNVGAFGVTFLASPNLLMVRPIDPNGEVGKQITRLKSCLTTNLRTLQEGADFEPSWAEATNLAAPDDIAAWSGVAAAATPAAPTAPAKVKK
jgi:TRAP-type uncharacterized transport system substrate-binding protein